MGVPLLKVESLVASKPGVPVVWSNDHWLTSWGAKVLVAVGVLDGRVVAVGVIGVLVAVGVAVGPKDGATNVPELVNV